MESIASAVWLESEQKHDTNPGYLTLRPKVSSFQDLGESREQYLGKLKADKVKYSRMKFEDVDTCTFSPKSNIDLGKLQLEMTPLGEDEPEVDLNLIQNGIHPKSEQMIKKDIVKNLA
jgi:hypothetical protein